MTPTDTTPPGQPEGTLEALRELSERATPGPWQEKPLQDGPSGPRRLICNDQVYNIAKVYDRNAHPQNSANSSFIVASVNYVRALLSRDPAPPAAGELRTDDPILEMDVDRALAAYYPGNVAKQARQHNRKAMRSALLATIAAQAATIAGLRAELERAITLASDFQNWRDFLKARAEKAEAALAAANGVISTQAVLLTEQYDALAAATARPERATVSRDELAHAIRKELELFAGHVVRTQKITDYDRAVAGLRDTRDRLLALLAQQPEAQGGAVAWKPMSEAKRDGVTILVNFRSKGVRAVHWDNPHYDEVTAENGLWCVDDDMHGPYPLRGYSEGDELCWTEVPAPPATSDRRT